MYQVCYAPRYLFCGQLNKIWVVLHHIRTLFQERIATAKLKVKVVDITFRENFLVTTRLARPINDSEILQRHSTILHMPQGFLNFIFYSIQPKIHDTTTSKIEWILNALQTKL